MRMCDMYPTRLQRLMLETAKTYMELIAESARTQNLIDLTFEFEENANITMDEFNFLKKYNEELYNVMKKIDLKMYYDPEYDRIVSEKVPKKQYEIFSKESWFNEPYEKFLADNFLNTDMTRIEE